MSDFNFDAELDAHQEREAQWARERARIGDIKARRPDAQRCEITFADLKIGDFMTNETGPEARFVKVVEIGSFTPKVEGQIAITFETAEPLGVALENRWVIERPPTDSVTIDESIRGESS